MNMFLDTLVVGPIQTNSYVVACEETKEAIIIDPGEEAERIYRVVTFQGFTLQYVLATHGHPDHVGGVADLVEKTGVPFLMHEADLYLIEGFAMSPIRFFLNSRKPPQPDRFLQDGETIAVGKLEFDILHTPGHTPGGVCLLVGKTLFSGDTLFANSIGRTDLPGGDYEQLLASIRTQLLPLGDDVRVYPGHGSMTTIGNEQHFNPFF